MRKQSFLPPPLAEAPFTFGSARASGVTLDRLRRKDVVNVGRGLYRPADWDFDLEGAARALSTASPGAWISHVTAARLRRQVLPPWLADSTELHLSKPRALPSVRRKGIFGHTVVAREDEIELVDGIRLSTRSRTWLDLARVLPLDDLVSMGDELIRVPRVDFEARTRPYDTLRDCAHSSATIRISRASSGPAKHWIWCVWAPTRRLNHCSGSPSPTPAYPSPGSRCYCAPEMGGRRRPISAIVIAALLSSTTAGITSVTHRC